MKTGDKISSSRYRLTISSYVTVTGGKNYNPSLQVNKPNPEGAREKKKKKKKRTTTIILALPPAISTGQKKIHYTLMEVPSGNEG